VLKRENITTLDQLRAVAHQLERFENIGARTATVIREELARAAASEERRPADDTGADRGRRHRPPSLADPIPDIRAPGPCEPDPGGRRGRRARGPAMRLSPDDMRRPPPGEEGWPDSPAGALRARAEAALAETSRLIEAYGRMRARILCHVERMREIERELHPVLPAWAGELRVIGDRLVQEFGPKPAELQSAPPVQGSSRPEHRSEQWEIDLR
jgi:hypothetical protein